MSGLSLFLVFVLARIASIWGHAAPLTVWSLVAYVWQDAMVALAFGAIAMTVRGAGTRALQAIYWALALYAAINIPVMRAVFTPLTPPMLRAAGGPLADSILMYVTGVNLLLIILVTAAAVVLPRMMSNAPGYLSPAAAVAGIAIVLAGPMAGARTDTHGMERNVVLALMGAALPRAEGATRMPEAAMPPPDWRKSRYEAASVEDLSRFSGSARGFNVVMIGLESTAAQYLSLYGGPSNVTPNLEGLAEKALVFDNAYAVYPESIKGLFSVLCSRYPAFRTQPDDYAKSDCRSLAAVLAGAGYRTAMFHSGRFAYLGMESIVRNRGYQTLEDAGDIGGNHKSSFGVDEPATVASMLAWVDALPRGQRFFITYLPVAGHHPYAIPGRGPFTGTAELDQYRNALHYGDASLGALMEGLRARGLDRNTVRVIYGDHGEAFHQHEGNYGHTFFIYEENIHVPLVISVPRATNVQRRARKVVSLVDVAPTILDLMGIAPPDCYQGRTMLDRSPRMSLFFADYSLGLLGLRDGPWKFIFEIGSGKRELFNLDHDPRETVNLAAGNSARASWYEMVVLRWSKAQKSGRPR